MNNVNLVGRLVSNPELRYTTDNKAYSRVNLAVDRGLSKEDKEAGKQSADFISCVFWNKTAENLTKYMKKGSQIAITGKLRTGSYDAEDGTKRYTTDVRVENLLFLENKTRDERPEPEYDGPEEQKEETDPFAEFGEQVSIDDNFLE